MSFNTFVLRFVDVYSGLYKMILSFLLSIDNNAYVKFFIWFFACMIIISSLGSFIFSLLSLSPTFDGGTDRQTTIYKQFFKSIGHQENNITNDNAVSIDHYEKHLHRGD